MKFEIDQSGKIEQTSKNTILAYSNGTQKNLLIPKKLKRQILEIFRACGYTRLFVYYLFSIGVFYLVSDLKQRAELIIDTEYPGKDKLIKSLIEKLLEKYNKKTHIIHFARIGHHPRAHYAAKDVFDKKIPPNKTLTFFDVVKTIKKTDGRLRECLSTLVDAQTRSMIKRYHKSRKTSRRKRRR